MNDEIEFNEMMSGISFDVPSEFVPDTMVMHIFREFMKAKG